MSSGDSDIDWEYMKQLTEASIEQAYKRGLQERVIDEDEDNTTSKRMHAALELISNMQAIEGHSLWDAINVASIALQMEDCTGSTTGRHCVDCTHKFVLCCMCNKPTRKRT